MIQQGVVSPVLLLQTGPNNNDVYYWYYWGKSCFLGVSTPPHPVFTFILGVHHAGRMTLLTRASTDSVFGHPTYTDNVMYHVVGRLAALLVRSSMRTRAPRERALPHCKT